MTRLRRTGSRLLAGGLAILATGAVGLVASTGAAVAAGSGTGSGGPSAGQVAAARATVATLESQVGAAASAIATTQARVADLQTQTEVAVEAYDAAQTKVVAAQQAVAAADQVLSGATASLHDQQLTVAQFALADYESGGVPLSTMNAILTAGGPGAFVDRLGTIAAVSAAQRDVIQKSQAAAAYLQVLREQDAQVLARAAQTRVDAAQAAGAVRAKLAATSAGLASLTRQRANLNTLLHHAQLHATSLERARLAAIARAREAAARAAAARAAAAAAAAAGAQHSGGSPWSGSSGSLADTISAATGQQAVQQAESQLGKPYQWGATGPDTYDCSGLTMWSYAQVGVTLQHWTGYQWTEGAHIAQSDLRPGDLVFFATNTSDPNTIHHVGMYIGNGQMVEAPYTGANVRISNAFRPDYIGAVRPYRT